MAHGCDYGYWSWYLCCFRNGCCPISIICDTFFVFMQMCTKPMRVIFFFRSAIWNDDQTLCFHQISQSNKNTWKFKTSITMHCNIFLMCSWYNLSVTMTAEQSITIKNGFKYIRTFYDKDSIDSIMFFSFVKCLNVKKHRLRFVITLPWRLLWDLLLMKKFLLTMIKVIQVSRNSTPSLKFSWPLRCNQNSQLIQTGNHMFQWY